MPDDLKISAMTPITGANIAADDVIPVVDVSTSTNRNITRDEYLSEVKRVIFSRTNYDAAPEEGVLTWDADEKTLSLGLNGGDTVLQIGQESHIRVRNNSGALIANGTVVMQVGTIGNSGRLTIAKAVADGSVDGHRILGITTEDIANGADGLVTNFGKVRQINTTAFADGAVLYANPAVPGGMTATRPAHPNAVVVVAFVVHSHASGTLFVHPSYESQPEMVTLTGTQTLTNKTINLASNTLVATSAQLRAALTDETGTGAAVFAGSPALTGTPTAPTATQGTSTTQVATTAFVTDTGVTLTRAQLVTRCASGWRAVAGQILWADGVAYVGSAGATAISDLPGLLPINFVSPRHFGAKCDGNNDTTAISAAWAYYQTIQVDGATQFAPVSAMPFKWNTGVTRANSGLILTMTGVGATMIGDGEVSQVRNVTIKTENAQNPRIRNFQMRQILGKAISSIADNGAGKIRVTTTTEHGLSVGEYTRVNGTAAYDDYEARVEVLAVVSTTVVDLDRAYVAPAGAQGVLGGDAIVLGPGTNSAHITDMHLKEIAGVGIAYDGAASTRTARNHVEKSMYGMAMLEQGAGNLDEGSNFETCQRFCIDVRVSGELKLNGTRAGGVGVNNVNDAGGWATMRIHSRPSTVTADGVVEHYYTNVSLSGSRSGGRRYDIVSIADNGSGKLRITTSTPHELCVGNGDTVLNGTAAYDAGGAKSNVLAVISPTVFDLDRTYVSSAGAVGQVWYDGWDLLIVTETPLPNVTNDQKFIGGNINKTKIDGGYKIEFIGTRLKDAIYLTNNVYNNRIMIVGDGRGRANSADTGNTLVDIPVYGPGSHRGWSRLLSGIDNPTDPLVNGGERLVLQAPYTAAGVGADSLPQLVENGVNKDGILWRVNGQEATIKEADGLLTMEGVNKIVEPTLTGIIALENQVAQLAGNEAAMQLAITNSSLKRASRFAARAALAIATEAAWDPITGLGAKLIAWWDADSYATHMVDDGAGLISSWTDRVLGRAVTATTTARPTYQATGLYGRPCVSFDGVANVLSTTTLTGLPTGSAAGGLVAVTGPWAVAATAHAVAYGSTGTNAARRLSTNTGGAINSSNNTIAQTGTTANVALNVLIGEWNVTTASLHQNGVTSGDSPEAVTMATATSYFRMGASVAGTPSQFAAVQIADVMVIDGILTPYERRKLESYLAHKRGVPNILPATHAFGAYPPRALPAKPSPYAYRYATTGSGGGKMSSASAAVGAYTGFKGRIVQKIGNDDVSEIKIGWSNWYIDNLATAGAETDNPDAVTISKVAVVYDGIVVPVTFDSGSRSVVLAAGETLKLSDTINASDFGFDRFKAGTLFQVRYMGTLAGAGAKMLFNARDPNDFGGVNKGQGFWYDPAFAVDDVDATGSMTTPTGNQGDLIIKPTAIIGKYDSAVPVVEVFGDSIPHGLNDFYSGGWSSNGVGGANGKVNGGGFMRRALGNLGMAYSMTTKVGHQYAHMAANYAKRATFFTYSTHAVFTLGTNDVNAGTSAAAIMAYATPIWAAYRAAGGQGIIHTTIVPRVVANDWAGTDLEHQTHNPGYELGGERDKLNAALRNARASTLDEVVDIARPVSDRNNPSKWAVPNYRSALAVASLSTDTSLTFSAPPTAEMALILEPGLPTVDKGAYNVLSVSGNVATFTAAPMAAGHSIGAAVAATLADDGTHPSAQAQRMMAQEVAAALVMLEAVS